MSDESCSNQNDTCATLNRCPDLVESLGPDKTPETCGFDTKQSLLMVCCPTEAVKEVAEQLAQKPRFPAKNGRARKCEDRSKLCRRWKEKGCRLDKHLYPSRVDPLGFSVNSVNLFDFMQTACAKECGWCGSKGCVDEHPKCPEWARSGLCLTASTLMAHTCRESCGVCGFLSPHNKEIQEMDGDVSYTEFTGRNFDCGRNKKLCEINDVSCDLKPKSAAVDANEATTKIENENKATNDADDASDKNEVTVLNEETNSNAGIDASLVDLRDSNVVDLRNQGEQPVDEVEDPFCGNTLITDRWAVSAAHCYDSYGTDDKKNVVRIRQGTPFEETVEIRNVYRHPAYRFPRLYNDVAVLELGRRIEYDFERIGDTPTCIDQGQEKEGKIATVQGFGLTESGTKGELLGANVTVISNQMCKDIFQTNLTSTTFRTLVRSIPLGLEYGMMCTQGIFNPESSQTTGTCKGDSGSPLYQGGINQRKTLIGIVSGGVACGSSYPSWLTRVESFTKWIGCILEQAVRFNNQYDKVEEQCKRVVEDPPDCKAAIADPVTSFFVFDLRAVRNLSTDESQKLCDSYYSTGPIQLPDCDALFFDCE